MVLNAAVQMLREADELKETISKFKSGTSMLQERTLWASQQQLQKIYQKVLVLDLDYALDKKVEQDLWNIGFKQQIEALQAISKDRKNPLRSEGQAMLSWILQAAAGFYLCLLHQICTTFQLDLPFRRRASLLGWVEGWGAGEAGSGARLPAPAAARYICQHCLVHLGDLARYRQQLRIAHTFYRHALVVSVHSGQPYNQLALVAWRRARRLAALYWHVRSLLVRAPFPPAPANLARTLRAAALPTHTLDSKELPVLPGVTPAARDVSSHVTLAARDVSPHVTLAARDVSSHVTLAARDVSPHVTPQRLDAHAYVTEFIRALHYIHTGDDLDTAATLVKLLNSSLTTLIATNSFESMTLIKMACIQIWLVQSCTEDFTVEASAQTEGEARGAALACSLAGGALLAMLLAAYTREAPPEHTLPAVKVWLEWMCGEPAALAACAGAAPALWPALAHALCRLAPAPHGHAYATVPLPEDEELHGFLPLEGYLKRLRFPNHAAWDMYGARVPSPEPEADCESPQEVPTCLLEEPELQKRVRAYRLVQLGKRLAEMRPELMSFTEEDGKVTFTAAAMGGEQLSTALAELNAARGAEGEGPGQGEGAGRGEGDEADSEDEMPLLRPPIVISEADFKEKVREKRAGILKPQGSLERAREERALLTQDEQDEGSEDGNKGEDKKELRKPRVNIAMAAIMRKQEETNKQVKFVTPPPTPESPADGAESKEDKPKVIQPKAMKSLANLPIGRKTGGILALKDKSGYPHLVNTEPEHKKEKEEKIKEPKPSQNSGQTQTYPKRQELPASPTWPAHAPQQPEPAFTEAPRMTFHKNYGIQNAGGYGAGQPAAPGIRLPVVNPKEIDVRTAALQKQNSRQEPFPDGHKFNHGYQMSGDKKNFLNDLPPRFANQYRYWQAAQENQFNDNKFRDDGYKPTDDAFDPPRGGWAGRPRAPEPYAAPTWWKPDSPAPNFNYSAPPLKPNYFAHAGAAPGPYPPSAAPGPYPPSAAPGPYPPSAAPGPYPPSTAPGPYQGAGAFGALHGHAASKADGASAPYLPSSIGQPMQTLQSLVTSPNFNSSLNGFGSFAASAPYDAGMYPRFASVGYRALQPQKAPTYQDKDLLNLGVGFGNDVNVPRNLGFNEPMCDVEGNTLEQNRIIEGNSGEALSNTYSLFSGAPNASSWGSMQNHPPQSLWSGPGPSPLERLLEQQKQMSGSLPPAPQ